MLRLLLGVAVCAVGSSSGRQTADGFWILDPVDALCLTPLGTLGPCDGDAMWMYLSRGEGKSSLVSMLEPQADKACLVRDPTIVRAGKCSPLAAQSWEIVRDDAGKFALTADRQKSCVVRDSAIWSYRAQLAAAIREGKSLVRGFDAETLKKKVPKHVAHNTLTVQRCSKGHTPVELHTANVHEHGFMLASADTKCFDGLRFRPCSDEDAMLRWGYHVDFTSGGVPEARLYKFYNTSACLVAGRDGAATLGACDRPQAKGFGLRRGRLIRGGDGDRTGTCLVRTLDAGAALVPCYQETYEHLTLTLDSDGSDVLERALTEAAKQRDKAATKK